MRFFVYHKQIHLPPRKQKEMASRKVAIAVAKGDGIGPEIMDAALHIFEAAKVPLQYKFVEMGNKFYKNGFSTGVSEFNVKVLTMYFR